MLAISSSLAMAQNTIEIGTTYQRAQPANSTVAYQITLPQPGEYNIHMTGWTSTYNWEIDYDRLYIKNDESETVQRGQFSSDIDPFAFHMFQDSDQLIFRVGTAGTYSIDVHSGSLAEGVSQGYGLQVTATYCNDAHELNDTLATATSITLGATNQAYQWKRNKSADVVGDEDYYKIQIPTPGKLKIDLIDWEAVYNWGADFDRFFIYDAAGNNIGGNGDDGYYSWMMGGGTAEEPVAIEMNLAKGGTYYIRFHAGAATSLTPYSFTTSFTQANDLSETNDTFATAKPILTTDTWHNAYAWRSLDQTMTVTGDEDYYYFNAAGPGQYTVTLENWISIYNWGADYDRLYVYNASQQSVGASPFSWMMGVNPVTFEIPAAGKYYIRLHCGAGYSLDGYRIKLTTIPSEGFGTWVTDTGVPEDRRGPLDHNGAMNLQNLMAYTMGLDPMTATASDLPKVTRLDPAVGTLHLVYRCAKDLGDATLTPRVSRNLVSWAPANVISESVVEDGGDWEKVDVLIEFTPRTAAFFNFMAAQAP